MIINKAWKSSEVIAGWAFSCQLQPRHFTLGVRVAVSAKERFTFVPGSGSTGKGRHGEHGGAVV